MKPSGRQGTPGGWVRGQDRITRSFLKRAIMPACPLRCSSWPVRRPSLPISASAGFADGRGNRRRAGRASRAGRSERRVPEGGGRGRSGSGDRYRRGRRLARVARGGALSQTDTGKANTGETNQKRSAEQMFPHSRVASPANCHQTQREAASPQVVSSPFKSYQRLQSERIYLS